MAKIKGTRGEDHLFGTDGDDVIKGLAGGDYIEGGAGSDRIDGGDGQDTLKGGLGDDVINGGADGDYFEEFDGGNDRLFGDAGDDTIWISRSTVSTPSRVLADGGEGDDTLTLNGSQRYSHRVTLRGGVGDDELSAAGGKKFTLDGGDGNDVLTVSGSLDCTLIGGAGDDVANIRNDDGGKVVVDLGSGADQLFIDVSLPGDAEYALVLGPDRDVASFVASSPAFMPEIRFFDFETGATGDQVDIGYWLPQLLTDWDGGDPFASGHLRLIQAGAATQLQVDLDGGADDWRVLITFGDTIASRFRPENLVTVHPAAIQPDDPWPTIDTASDWLLA